MAAVQRMCVVCRTMKEKNSLLKVTLYKDEFHVDTTGKLPGRGAYICKTGECKDNFEKKRAFERAFKRMVPDQLKETIKKELI